MRTFGVHDQFEAIKKSATEALTHVFPIEGKYRSITLDSVAITDNLRGTNYEDQAKTKARGTTWGVPVEATLTLHDKATGKEIDHSTVRLFTLPKITPRLSYIVNGNEYQVHNQLRLKSGVYTVRKQNGELKTLVNLSQGKNFELVFDEGSSTFHLTKVGGGQAKIPLYPLLTHLGLSDGAIADGWGAGIAAANKSASPTVVARAASAFGIKGGTLKEYLENTRLNPEMTKLTLGGGFDRVSAPMLLAASKQLLQTHLGKAEPQDLNSLEYKELHSLEDFIHERLEKNAKTLRWRLARTVDNPKRTKLTQMVNPGAFSSVVESFFTQDDKSATPEQTNPLEMISGQYAVTIRGAGGIKSEHAITDDMREVHPTHLGFADPTHTPESFAIGANLHIPLGVVKDGKTMKRVVLDSKGGSHLLSPGEAFNVKIAFPDQKGDTLQVQYKGQTVTVPRAQVDYFSPAAHSLFSWSSNLIPYLPATQGNRAMMAAKQLEQAVSLKHREAPHVRVAGIGDDSFEHQLGRESAVVASLDGVVKRVTPDSIVIKGSAGEQRLDLYNHFILNRKSYLHHEPLVKEGDKVKKGQVLADSNFTKGGTLALGTNLRTAYIPYHGYNVEDGIVITDSAAEKLTSQHIHRKGVDRDDNTILNLATYRTQYPNAITADNLKKLDDDGVIKKGEHIQHGETVIAALHRREPSAMVGTVQRALADRPRDNGVHWTYDDPGEVIDVQKTSKGITVFIRTEERARIGDKLSGRFGNKGIITKIIPDHESPHNAAGEPVQVMLNPHGVVSRINVGQIYESAAGKVVKKTGIPHVVRNFNGQNYLDTTRAYLKANAVDDKEELFDPRTKKSLGQVHVGYPHLLKLFKLSHGNFSVRQGGPGTPYDLNLQPLKAGGEDSAKALDLLTMYSMLSHGARANLREMSSLKSNQNDEFWTALKAGQPLPPPKTPFVYDKFMSFLKGAGINTDKQGSTITLSPLTDHEVRKQSSGEVLEPAFFRGKDMEPIKGGFLDPVKFGGYKGTKWGHLELKEPVVNPVFENAVKKLTGLGNKYKEITGGKLHLDEKGQLNTDGRGVTGGAAIEQLLKKIDVDRELAAAMKKVSAATGASLDDLNKKIRYLQALKKYSLKPHEAYLRRMVPVLPPVYRPVYALPDGNVASSDVNYLYQNIAMLNKLNKQPVMDLLPEEDKAELRHDLNEHMRGLSGLTDLQIKGRPRAGFISEIKGGEGGQPKEGFFISKMLSKRQDFVGRGTIIPEPSLGVDEVAIPEKMAWKLFEPFVIRELGKMGKRPNAALVEITKRTELARRALELVMRDRKVLLNRAPSLHKFSIMAFHPKITDGTAIKIPPVVTRGFNADHDGDTMSLHVPIHDDANREAEKLLPSRNLYQPGTGQLMLTPVHDAQTGLFYLSRTPEGRAQLTKILGAKYAVKSVLDKKGARDLFLKLSKELPPNEFSAKLTEMKLAGETHAYDRGFTLGMNDINPLTHERDRLMPAILLRAKNAKSQEELVKLNQEATTHLDRAITGKLQDKNNPLYDMVESGAKGSKSQLRSILATPLFVADAKGRVVPHPITKSYAEGLSVRDYWTSMYGVRRGMMDRAIQTSLPGSFSKDIMANTIDNVVSAVDCGTKKGIVLPIDSADALERYLAADQAGLTRNTLVDHGVIAKLKAKGLKTVQVRSPLTCLQPKGVCAKCYGIDEHGHAPAVGENVGAKAGQTIAEPLIQLTMRTFHSGGTAGTGADVTGYKRIDQLLKMPKVVVGATTLAPVAGTITKIEKGVAGGHDVWVGDTKAHISQGRALKVKLGSHVAVGDPLADGVIKPQDLVKYKGMQPAQAYIVDELHKAYSDQGVRIHRKMFETVIRSLGNITQVLNKPKHSDFVPGDIIPYTVARHYNETRASTMKLEDAVGHALTTPIGPFKEGHVLESKDVAALHAMGMTEVAVTKDALQHAPLLKSVNTLPLLRRNWMSALGYRNLSKALTEGAGQAWTTDLEDYHPVPSFAHGATFGQGKDGKY